MIKHISHSKINFKKWDNCIANSVNSTIYPYSWYLDMVSPGWEALVAADYKTVMPLTHNSKYGINYLRQPFFTQQLGVFSTAKLTESILTDFLTAIPEKYKFVEINLNVANQTDRPDFSCKKNHTYTLDLSPSYETIYNNYSGNTRRNIKKAIKHKLILKKNAKPELILNLFRANRGRHIKTLGPKQYVLLDHLIKDLLKRGCVQIFSAESPTGDLCAGAFFAEVPGHSVFLFSGSDPAARENGAMFFLIDRYISENAERSGVLDFNGSNNPDLARFYTGFGSEQQSYRTIRKNSLPRLLKWMKNR